jgi:hypothetical protein
MLLSVKLMEADLDVADIITIHVSIIHPSYPYPDMDTKTQYPVDSTTLFTSQLVVL